MEPCRHSQHHAACMGRLCKEAVHIVAKRLLHAISHSARRSADPAGDIDEQRMILIYRDILLFKLCFQAFSRHAVSHKEVL